MTMTTNSRKTRTRSTNSTKMITNAPAVQAAAPMPPPPVQAGVILPENVLAELRAGTELLTELLIKANAAMQTQVVDRELRDAKDAAWAGKLSAETPTPPSAPQAMRTDRIARGSSPPPSGTVLAAAQQGGRKADLNDPRLKGLTELERVFAGWKIKVRVQPEGFEWGGKVWPSLSAIARAVTGTRRNGFEFFNLTERHKTHS
jgi:hypothetical protein